MDYGKFKDDYARLMNNLETIREKRLNQPIEELWRKARRAVRYKSKIWTQEELDWAKAKGRLWGLFKEGINASS